MCRPISHSVLPRTKLAPFGSGSIEAFLQSFWGGYTKPCAPCSSSGCQSSGGMGNKNIPGTMAPGDARMRQIAREDARASTPHSLSSGANMSPNALASGEFSSTWSSPSISFS